MVEEQESENDDDKAGQHEASQTKPRFEVKSILLSYTKVTRFSQQIIAARRAHHTTIAEDAIQIERMGIPGWKFCQIFAIRYTLMFEKLLLVDK